MACKALDSAGCGSVSAAIAGIDYARTHGASVINASWVLSYDLSHRFDVVDDDAWTKLLQRIAKQWDHRLRRDGAAHDDLRAAVSVKQVKARLRLLLQQVNVLANGR